LELRDADVDENGRPNDGNAMTAMVITIAARDGGGAVMAIRTHFDSPAGMEQVLAMGIEEGMRTVLLQMDAVLAATAARPAHAVAGFPPGHRVDPLSLAHFGEHDCVVPTVPTRGQPDRRTRPGHRSPVDRQLEPIVAKD